MKFGIEYDRTIFPCNRCGAKDAPYCVYRIYEKGSGRARMRSAAGWCIDCIGVILRLEHDMQKEGR